MPFKETDHNVLLVTGVWSFVGALLRLAIVMPRAEKLRPQQIAAEFITAFTAIVIMGMVSSMFNLSTEAFIAITGFFVLFGMRGSSVLVWFFEKRLGVEGLSEKLEDVLEDDEDEEGEKDA